MSLISRSRPELQVFGPTIQFLRFVFKIIGVAFGYSGIGGLFFLVQYGGNTSIRRYGKLADNGSVKGKEAFYCFVVQ
jgi:hypothetical protein